MWETENVKIYEKKKNAIVNRCLNPSQVGGRGESGAKETDNNIACFNNNLKTKLN